MDETKDDYKFESSEGFSSKIFGPILWFFLHMITFNFPANPTKEDKHHYRDFFKLLGFVLPCRVCRENYQKKTNKLSLIHFRSRHTLSRWLYKLHEEIPHHHELPVSYEDMRNTYELFRSKCGPKGCINPVNHVKSRCVLSIEPIEEKNILPNFHISKKCFAKKKK
jgi:hypothetical protein